ncbi:MAG: hypothetical protein ACOX2W_15755 [Desulfomonilia bacterium]
MRTPFGNSCLFLREDVHWQALSWERQSRYFHHEQLFRTHDGDIAASSTIGLGRWYALAQYFEADEIFFALPPTTTLQPFLPSERVTARAALFSPSVTRTLIIFFIRKS